MVRFSCFPSRRIFGQKGRIKLPILAGTDAAGSSIARLETIQRIPEIPVEPETVSQIASSGDPATPRGPNISDEVNERKKGVIGKRTTLHEGPTPVYDKEAKSREQIKNAILKNEFLGYLEEFHIEDLVMAMRPEEIAPGSFVIEQGDIGNNLYVSAEGEFNIWDGDTLQGSFGPGVVFGELALLYDTKRWRSIEVKKGGKVWVLDRAVFRTVMMRSVQDRLHANIRFLRRITIFQSLPEPKDHVLVKISDLLRVEFFPAGTRIVRQGEEGDKFFIIRNGTVKITRDTIHAGEEQMVVLERGKYFGEKALLNEGENRRHANAIAVEPGVECFTLDRQSFLDHLGGLEEIRTKNWMAEYERQNRSLSVRWVSEYASLKLSDLELKKTLGVGAFGRVELVVSRHAPEKSFALKQLKKKEMVENHLQDNVVNEKRIMQACRSPFICQLYQTYKDRKYVYFLMEVCLGGDVWTALQRRRQFDDPTARFIVACVVEALDHLHSLGIVYRDLKPENLMLDARGYVKLVDFGFSKRIGPEKSWTIAGTPGFMAPEIILGKGHDRAVDYWSLGVLTHELLVGKPPFGSADHIETYHRILKGIEDVIIPRHVARSATNFIRKLLRLSPSDRLGYQRKGVREIRDHRWFSGLDWDALRRMTLPAPIIPEVRSHTDTSNFATYSAEGSPPPDETSGWDEDF